MTVLQFRLFVMMVLEIAVWGAWFPQIFGYLPGIGFDPGQQSWILNAFPIGAILAMFFSTQFADRYFSAEKFLAVSHLIAGASMIGLAYTKDFWPFLILMYIHCIFYVPTVSITNSIAFTHMKDPQREFGPIRMGGTIGWILAAWPFVFLLVDYTRVPAFGSVPFTTWFGAVMGSGLTGEAALAGARWSFVVAGSISLALAVYSLTLPHTPPKKGEALAWLEALKLLKHPFLLVLWIVTFIDASVHQCFFSWTYRFLGVVGIPANWIQPVMSIGQVAEILTMLILGVTLKNLGWKATMTVGILGHAVRFAVFAFLPDYPSLIVLVNLIHGICYAFFFATVYIFVDEFFPKDVRSSAQGLFNFMIMGLGTLVPNLICPILHDQVYGKQVPVLANGEPVMQNGQAVTQLLVDYRGLFLVPMFASIVAVVILALCFHPPKKPSAEAMAPAADA